MFLNIKNLWGGAIRIFWEVKKTALILLQIYSIVEKLSTGWQVINFDSYFFIFTFSRCLLQLISIVNSLYDRKNIEQK